MDRSFRNRTEAGKMLAERFSDLQERDDVLVFGLARGGVPVAAEVARAIGAELDAFIVRKIGVPGHEELAMGAVASGEVMIKNADIIDYYRVTDEQFQGVVDAELAELHRREQEYRGTTVMPDVADKIVLLIDDGLATGTTMHVAVLAARALNPREIMIGVPVGSREAVQTLEQEVDRLECLMTPAGFTALGLWYEDFRPTTDDEVRATLAKSR